VRTLAEVYRQFGEAATTSPLLARVALALSGSDEAMAALEAAPARRRQPQLVLAALHDLALAGRAPALAADTAIGTLVRMTADVVTILERRRVRTVDAARCAVLYPAVAEAARRVGADAVGLIGVASSAGLDLHLDRVGITYGDGPRLGDPSSPVQLTPSVVGGGQVPGRAVPEVVARISVDPEPLDLTDTADARWLRACLPPDQPDRRARLEAELTVVGSAPPVLLEGDPVDLLGAAIALVPAGVLPVVTTTWALSALSTERRQRVLDRLGEAAASRAVAWVSAEGVGVAPSVPTFGDRPASGHSIIGLALLHRGSRQVEAVGRCWSRGRLLSWSAGS